MGKKQYDLAKTMLGMNAGDNREKLMDYFATGGINLDPQELAWCAAFVNGTLGSTGEQGTGKANARSFLDYGEKATVPGQGDIAVFKRGSNPAQGHVGFIDQMRPNGDVSLLGGNQGEPGQVSIKDYPADRVLDFRRPKGPSGPVQAAGGGLGADPVSGPNPMLADLQPPLPTARPDGGDGDQSKDMLAMLMNKKRNRGQA